MDSITTNIHEEAWSEIEDALLQLRLKLTRIEDSFGFGGEDYVENNEETIQYLTQAVVLDTEMDYLELLEHLDRRDLEYGRDFGSEYPISRLLEAVTRRDIEDIELSLEDLPNFCDRCEIIADDEIAHIKTCIKFLKIKTSTLIYVPDYPKLFVPQLIINVQAKLIEMIARRPEYVFEISPRQFEEIIAELFFREGYEVELTKQTRDGGYDIV